MQGMIDEHGPKDSEQIHPTDASEQGSSNAHNLKLSAVWVPIFSGQYDRWFSFGDMFNAMIHEHDSLPEIQKFHYLKPLSGEAERLISKLPIVCKQIRCTRIL